MEGKCSAMRVIALVGPGGAGKTSLSESLLYASGEISRQGSVEAGTTVGDSSPEARARQSSTEPNLLRFQYMGDDYGERTSVVKGTSVSVRVDLGGTRLMKQKILVSTITTTHNQTTPQ